jgi:putative ABC transport system permease protein
MNSRGFLLREPTVVALQALWAHKLRSLLTVLGIIIAVTTLIVVVSIVNGLNTYIEERVANLGTNTFYIQRYGIITNAKDFLEARRKNKKITLEDYAYVRQRLTLAEEVGALAMTLSDVRAANEELEDVNVYGVSPNMVNFNETAGAGRYISEADYQRRALVAYIGTDIAKRFFPNVDPLGKTVRLRGLPFEIIGQSQPIGSALGQSRDNFVTIPLSTYLKLFGEGPPDDAGIWIGVKYSSPEIKAQVRDQARGVMRNLRGQKYNEKDAFGIIASESLTQLWNTIFGGIASLAIGIVSVFMVVGGIVIMNIMLASVTERTREIGIRKSLGARRRDILMQFLVEASVMSTIGGMIGVAVALLITVVVSSTTDLPMRTPLGAVILAVGVSSAVGLFFGIYPAQKAARYTPVIALRAE